MMHPMAKAYRGLADSVGEGAQHGINIHPWDIRITGETSYLSDEYKSLLETELKHRSKKLSNGLFVHPEIYTLYEDVFGMKCPYPDSIFGGVLYSIASHDIELAQYRHRETEVADLMHKVSDGAPFAGIMGSNHLQGDFIKRLRKNSRHGITMLDINLWGNTNNTVFKAFASGETCPVYSVRHDTITYPEELNLNPEKIKTFRTEVLEMADARPVILPGIHQKSETALII